MLLQLSFVAVEFFAILCAFTFQKSAGIGLHSLSEASVLFGFKDETPDFRLHEATSRLTLLQSDIDIPPTPTSSRQKRHGMFASAPHLKAFHNQLHVYHPLTEGTNPQSSSNAHAPSMLSGSHRGKKSIHISAFSPSHKFQKNHHTGRNVHYFAPGPYNQSPSYSGKVHSHPPTISPMSLPMENMKKTPLPLALPPPPPNQECTTMTCTEPLTYAPPGAPCGCVWPIEVRLRFSISLYTFFPLVPNLTKEIANSILLDQSQVRIMGADAANHQLEKSTVLINLVPLDTKFSSSTAYQIFTKFWKREVSIRSSVFGIYEVVYVRYPGLPPSPPSKISSSATIDDQKNTGSTDDGGPIKPLGVDVPRTRKDGTGKTMVIVIVLSAVTAFVVCMGCIWLLLLKCGCCSCLNKKGPQGLMYLEGKSSGIGKSSTFRSKRSSGSMSLSSSFLACTTTAKVFCIDEIERATDNFNASRILGEGGFGLVYGGTLDDGRKVAVKVLKRDDHQGSREFLAEVEMLSRLHHRNLVKLLGICAEDNCRSLIYELVPNGSVESHLHGVDKEVSPLDWRSRVKIALGAARGLTYLHEDSSPRVIHRDFKSSNILLEHDFTPKVSDFGLARTAMEEGNKHVSTHVMGTFGYLAPEYAMTGHLLVKSDVYSYGVVLLELLTGRKPVDLSQPPGQENLVAWARPLLGTKEGLEMIIDQALKSNVPSDSIAKFAAIASMCVQPEVSHRPFMGEVVQALKLVCSEFDETQEPVTRSCSQEDFSIDIESKHSRISIERAEDLETSYPFPAVDSIFDTKIALSAVDLKGVSGGREGHESESFRRQFNSVPLKMGRKMRFWQRLRGLSRGSMSEREFSSIQ
ncbi:receptor-like serine threonine- kinase ALE2 [Olea europaea subsp. europaea]|uniref:Receptor-like serine threonine- kinase ALE2 n=1 Tax=Olea europaea subsp. europaea TaxID=158383 RepID=A0A8S0R6M6_OLEEU|nr:receptor-like serine threonine- kinase ALE2 [Olea europaea subsp. europaea]